uniref:Uncharacterized protein n=1 Tax=Onchocerca volvulus TaxID=6282 RepID=A0A8R1XXE8_ONCVO
MAPTATLLKATRMTTTSTSLPAVAIVMRRRHAMRIDLPVELTNAILLYVENTCKKTNEDRNTTQSDQKHTNSR